jgi:hypothetical protein
MKTNLLSTCSRADHGPRRYEEQVKRVNANYPMCEKAPRFGPWQDARHKHPGYREEHRDAKVAKAFIEQPSARSRKPRTGMEEDNGERRYAS